MCEGGHGDSVLEQADSPGSQCGLEESALLSNEGITRRRRMCSRNWAAAAALFALVIASFVFLKSGGLRPVTWTRPASDLPLVSLGKVSPETNKVLCLINFDQIISRVINLSSGIDRVTRNCDLEGIRRSAGNVTDLDREICASTAFVIILNANLLVGLITASISSCTGALNVPANCGTNIEAFIGGTAILLQAILAVDINCVKLKNLPIEEKIDDALSRARKQKDIAIRNAQKFIKNAGVHVDVLPALPAEPVRAVYSATALCVSFMQLGLTQVMRLGILLADTSIHCTPQENSKQPRVCAIDIIGLLLVVSAIVRAFALTANQCVLIVGDTIPSTRCLQACTGVTAGTFAVTARCMNVGPACNQAFQDWHPKKWLERVREGNDQNVHSGIPDKLREELEIPAAFGTGLSCCNGKSTCNFEPVLWS